MNDPSIQKVTAERLVLPVETEDGAALADLISVQRDLRDARRFALRLIERPSSTHNSEEDGDLRDALWNALVVAYRRAFGSGRSFVKGRGRTRYPDNLLATLPPESTEVHEHLLEEANQHIAHRVLDDRETGYAQLVLNPPTDPGVQFVTWGGLKYSGGEDTLVLAIPALCDDLLRRLDAELERLATNIRADATADLEATYRSAGLELSAFHSD